ncbi:MAG: hypothetical protein WKF84_23605 [Pyrinomonadaceae bacterium]
MRAQAYPEDQFCANCGIAQPIPLPFSEPPHVDSTPSVFPDNSVHKTPVKLVSPLPVIGNDFELPEMRTSLLSPASKKIKLWLKKLPQAILEDPIEALAEMETEDDLPSAENEASEEEPELKSIERVAQPERPSTETELELAGNHNLAAPKGAKRADPETTQRQHFRRIAHGR